MFQVDGVLRVSTEVENLLDHSVLSADQVSVLDFEQ